MNILETLENYQNELYGSKGSPKTCEVYIRTIKRFAHFTENKHIEKLEYKDFQRYKAFLFKPRENETEGRGASYIAGEISAMVDWLKFLKRFYKVAVVDITDIMTMRPPVPKGEPDPLEPYEVQILIEHAETIEEKTMIQVLHDTGLRIAELLQLQMDSIIEKELITADGQSLKVRFINIIGKGKKKRLIPLTAAAETALSNYIVYLGMKYPKGYVKLFPFSYVTAWRRIAGIGKRANIALNPHKFRSTFSTELAKRGVDTATRAKLLGHSSLDTTSIYTKIYDPALVSAINTLGKKTFRYIEN